MREMFEEVITDFAVKYDLGDMEIAELATDLADAIEGYFEYMSYSVSAPSTNSEIERLKRELEIEKSKIICPECKGSGEDVSYGPSHTFISRCPKCEGVGKVLP